jgi:thymidylate synthase (FAD)
MNMETTEKLLGYLAKHKHWSPFEMASATMEIETTRDIARQMLRHRSFAFQEFSQRYADPKEFGEQFVIREARLQDTKNRQNSIDTDDYRLQQWWKQEQEKVIRAAKEAYEWAIENGIAKEQARAVLPEGNTKSRLYMQGSIRSWIHFIELRSGNGTQKEHMEVAKACAEAIIKIFPLVETYINKE